MSSAWKIESNKEYPKLDRDAKADVCIVGEEFFSGAVKNLFK